MSEIKAIVVYFNICIGPSLSFSHHHYLYLSVNPQNPQESTKAQIRFNEEQSSVKF